MISADRQPNKSDHDTKHSMWEYLRAMASSAEHLPSGELAAFLAAYEVGTVQGAADALMLTQSAVTKRIQALERRVGAELFERSRTGVAPTRLGQTIYAPAKEALGQLQIVALAAQAARAGDSHELRLSASLTVGEFLLPAWLSAFRASRPEVHPQLEVVNSIAVLAAVRGGRAEIGFVEGGSTPVDLDTLLVARDELVVVVAAEHPWSRRRAIPVSALVGESYLTRERDSGTRAVATAALAEHGVSLEPRLEVASTQSLKRMIATSGFSILSRLAIVEEERAGTLVGCELRGVDLSRDLRAVRRSPPREPVRRLPAAQEFWAWLRARSLS